MFDRSGVEISTICKSRLKILYVDSTVRADYLKYSGNKVVSVNYAQLSKYFDEIEEAKDDQK